MTRGMDVEREREIILPLLMRERIVLLERDLQWKLIARASEGLSISRRLCALYSWVFYDRKRGGRNGTVKRMCWIKENASGIE